MPHRIPNAALDGPRASFPPFGAGAQVDEEGICGEVADANDGRAAKIRIDDRRQRVGTRADVAVGES